MLIKISLVFCQAILLFYVALFCVTSLPGNKMAAGISFGFAEATSNIIAGFILKYFKDKHALFGCFGLSFLC